MALFIIKFLAGYLLLCLIQTALAGQEPKDEAEQLLQRSKRMLTSICVEIQPSGHQDQPYLMCKLPRGQQLEQQPQQQQSNQQAGNYGSPKVLPTAVPAPVTPAVPAPAPAPAPAPMTPPAMANFPQQLAPMIPFPSFPVFGGGFFQAPTATGYDSIYGEAQSKAQPSSTSSGSSNSAGSYGSSAALAPASAAQSYGLPAVPYPAATGTQAASNGAAAGAGPAPPAHSYAAAAPEKSSQPTQSQQQPQPATSAYEGLVGSAQRSGLDADVLAVPNVDFRLEEFNQQYRRPTMQQEPMLMVPHVAPQVTAVLPLAQAQFQQPVFTVGMPSPAANPADYYDDPVMRVFYSSLPMSAVPPTPELRMPIRTAEQQLPAMRQQFQPQDMTAQLVGQAVPAYSNNYPQAAPVQPTAVQLTPTPSRPTEVTQQYGSYAPAPAPLPAPSPSPLPPSPPPSPMQPQPQPMQVTENACGLCNAPPPPPALPAPQCPVVSSNGIALSHYHPAPCPPSVQPVIIAMPCFGQQPPTHYLALPNAGYGQAAAAAAVQRGAGNGPLVGNPFAPQVGAPFGMGPVFNPFGPLGNLNPFNPFNRMLGAAPPPTPAPGGVQIAAVNPLQRLFQMGAHTTQQPTVEAPIETTTQANGKLNFNSFSSASSSTTEKAEPIVGAALENSKADKDATSAEEEEADEEEEEEEATDAASTEATAAGGLVGSSIEGQMPLSVKHLIDQAEQHLNAKSSVKTTTTSSSIDKRKRHNSRAGSSGMRKRKYLERL